MAVFTGSQISTRVFYTLRDLSIWRVLELQILANINFFSFGGSSAIWRCDTPPFLALDSKKMRYGFLKDAIFYPPPNFFSCILRLEFYAVVEFKDYRLNINFFSFGGSPGS